MQDGLIAALKAADVPERLISAVLDSGYFLKAWATGGPVPSYAVSDPFYGNKAFSSHFETAVFIRHLTGEAPIEPQLPFHRERVKSLADLEAILSDARRARYLAEGSLTFRGQPREYRVRRQIPSPARADADGWELSIMPGAYRQGTGDRYSLAVPVREQRSFERFAAAFEPANAWDPLAAHFSYDLMRTEQHYATQTTGLDLSFDLPTALFFATHQFLRDDAGHAYYRTIPQGEHTGVIYLFRFGSPSVRRTEYLIQDFDFFRTHRPERILRQACGLPYFGPYERNIAITDLDCIIELDPDFAGSGDLTPRFMFPAADEDAFYSKLLALKDEFPAELGDVVEYQWAREPRGVK